MTMCDGRVDVFGSGGGVKNTVTIDTHRHAKFPPAVRLPFSKGNEHWGAIRRLLGQRPTAEPMTVQRESLCGFPLGERKGAFDSPAVKSAFALLLTRVTEPEEDDFQRLEV